ncbi:MAG: lactonase family protein [Chloroflexota bacterium]
MLVRNKTQRNGIYKANLNSATGQLSEPKLAVEVSSPGFVDLHPNGKILYSLGRSKKGGALFAFSISEDRQLTFLNSQPIGDGGASHLSVDREGKCLFSSQYGGGSVAAFPLLPDGKIAPRSDLIEHSGSGPNKSRQRSPHPHWVGMGPNNRYLFVPDLGIDKVAIYKTDLENGKLISHGFGISPAGGGPRHMKFHPNGKFAYVLNELLLSVTAYKFDGEKGTLDRIQTIDSLPPSMWEIPGKSSEIRIHQTGKFLYAANRGHDSIACYRVDAKTGRLTFIEREAIRGSWPRNFNIDPSGKWLLAAGRHSNTIAVFKIDPLLGGLTFTGKIVNTPAPICIEFQ